MPLRSGLGGAIVDGIEQGMARNQIAMSTVMSCMAERGYLFRTRAEHEAVCAAIATHNAPSTKVKISAPAKRAWAAGSRPKIDCDAEARALSLDR